MHSHVERKHLAKELLWRGVVAQSAVAVLVAPFFGLGPAVSFSCGGLALVLGNWVSALYALRAQAPSGASAMLGVVGGTVMKWMVVAALLVLSMALPGAHVPWVFAGLVFAQVAMVVAVLTFKRR